MGRTKKSIWAARILIGFVALINLQCGVYFVSRPQFFAPAYQLTGIPGEYAIMGYGILFIMWIIPYIFAVINPLKFKVSLIEAILMQATGAIGETWIYSNLPAGYPILSDSMMRFIRFDAAGLVILILAFFLISGKPIFFPPLCHKKVKEKRLPHIIRTACFIISDINAN